MDCYKPLRIGKRLRVIRPGVEYPDEGRVDIVIKRGAFGSGEHETTVSCLEELEELDLKGKRLLDVGCGTGILSVAALKLGAAEVVAVDIDRAAVETTLENVRLNGLSPQIKVVLGTVNRLKGNLKGPFHGVMANIYPEVLRDIASFVAEACLSGGFLLASGIPWEDNSDIIELYKGLGFSLLKNRWLECYTTFVMLKA